MLDVGGLAARAKVNADDVDAGTFRGHARGFAVVHCALPHPAKFEWSERFGGDTGHVAAGTDLDEDNVIPIAGNDVDFAATGADLASDDVEPEGLETMGRDTFAEVTEILARVHHLNANWATGA